jgi:hypothetical protein
VRDGSAGNDPKFAIDTGSDADAQMPQLPPSSLTHELAQLLAAAIAQNQAGRGQIPATNADLTSLANLMSAAASQRTLAPVFKDGLSTLSYSRPNANLPQIGDPRAGEHHDDDEPMPIPSTWRQPTPRDEDRWVSQQMGAALLGLVAGLIIVVPTVLWLSGWFGTKGSRIGPGDPTVMASAETRTPEVRTMKVQVHSLERPPEAAGPYVTGSLEPRLPPEARQSLDQTPAASTAARLVETTVADARVAEARAAEARAAEARVASLKEAETRALEANAAERKVAEARAATDNMLARARRRLDSGDVTGAREILVSADDGAQGVVTFALAETYDPNMLAAWGSRGVAADVAKARSLYRKALGLGVAHAQNRLEALR